MSSVVVDRLLVWRNLTKVFFFFSLCFLCSFGSPWDTLNKNYCGFSSSVNSISVGFLFPSIFWKNLKIAAQIGCHFLLKSKQKPLETEMRVKTWKLDMPICVLRFSVLYFVTCQMCADHFKIHRMTIKYWINDAAHSNEDLYIKWFGQEIVM